MADYADKLTLKYVRSLIKYTHGNLHAEWKVFVDIAGSQTAAVLLRQILYWSGNPRTRARDGWFWKTKEDWAVETGLTKRELETAEPLLKTLLETERKFVAGSTKKLYRLRPEAFLLRLTKVLGIGIPGIRICGCEAATYSTKRGVDSVSNYTKRGVATPQNGRLLGDQLHETDSSGCTIRVAGRTPPPRNVTNQRAETWSSDGDSNKDSNRVLNPPIESPPPLQAAALEISETEKVSIELKAPTQKQADAWSSAYSQLEVQLDRASFETWLRGAVLMGVDGDVYVVGVRNEYAQQMCQHRLYRNIRRVLSDCFGEQVELRFEVHKPIPSQEEPEDVPLYKRLRDGPDDFVARKGDLYPPLGGQNHEPIAVSAMNGKSLTMADALKVAAARSDVKNAEAYAAKILERWIVEGKAVAVPELETV